MRLPVRLLALLCVLAVSSAAAAAQEADPIRAGYQLFYQGDLRGAYKHFRALQEREPENLAAAYGVLSALYARDLAEESLEQEFEERAERLIQRTDARRAKNPADSEALFYLAQAHGLRAGYRFTRRKSLFGAVRDATKSKHYSDAVVKQMPERADAYLALGLYNYYADIAPAFLKLLRVLLLVPGGDRVEGLKQIELAARDGEMWAPQAQLELIQIYGWLEGRVEDAVRLAENLNRAYPNNPEISFRLARLYAGPVVEDNDAAAKQFSNLLARADQHHPNYDAATRYQALLGLAGVRAQQWRLQEAVDLVDPVIESGVADPSWAVPRSRLLRARLRALLNDPEAADDLRRILAEPKWKEKWHEEARNQLQWIAAWRQNGEAARYAELIPGNRLVADRRWELAAKFYEQQHQLHPNDAQVRYRIARQHFLQRAFPQAEAGFRELLGNPGSDLPGWLKASVLLHLARLHDLRGERKEAVELYQKVADDYDEEGPALAARLGMVTPYKQVPTSH